MPQPRGFQTTYNLYDETTYGQEPGTPDARKIYLRTCGLSANQALVRSETLLGSRGQPEPDQDNIDVTGNIETEVGPENIGFMLKHLFGGLVTTGLDPYTHEFTPDDLPVGFTFEKDHGDVIVGSGRVERFNGGRIAQAQFRLAANGYPLITWEIRGANQTLDSAVLDATPTDTGFTPFTAFKAALDEGGGPIATVLNLDLTISNDLDDGQYVVGGAGKRADLPEGFCIVSGSITARFTDVTLMNKAINGTVSSLKYTLSRGDGLGSAGNESLVIELQKLKYERSSPQVQNARGIVQSFNFQGFADGADFIKATLKNAVATL